MNRFFCFFSTALLGLAGSSFGQDIPYGTNDDAGHRLQVDDVNLYYEVYGEGPPVLLLHGGLYGYINEFGSYITELSKRHTVIAPAMRGHGRSELGTKGFSLDLQASEAAAVLREVTSESATVIGFSHGGEIAYAFAAAYPKAVSKVVVIGAALHPTPETIAWAENFSAAEFNRNNAGFVRSRKQLMPRPERWDGFLSKLKAYYASGESLAEDQIQSIRSPFLIIGGDKDDYFPATAFADSHAQIANSYLLILPNCDHLGSLQRPEVLRDFVLPFVAQ